MSYFRRPDSEAGLRLAQPCVVLSENIGRLVGMVPYPSCQGVYSAHLLEILSLSALVRVGQGREEPYRFCGRIIRISNLLRMRPAIWGTRSHSCWERASGCAQTKKREQLGMAAEKSIRGKRRRGFRKVVAALCKIEELEGARENTNERQLHHLDTRRYFDYTHTCLAIYFPNHVPSNERRSLYEQLQFLCTRPNTLMGKSCNFSSSSKIDKRSS